MATALNVHSHQEKISSMIGELEQRVRQHQNSADAPTRLNVVAWTAKIEALKLVQRMLEA